MKGLLVHLLEARPHKPSLPVRSHLGRNRTLQLLLEGVDALGVRGSTSDPGDTGEPSTDVEVVLTGLGTPDEARLGENVDEVGADKVGEGLPVGGRLGEEGGVGELAAVDLLDGAVACELGGVEVLELGALGGGGILVEGVLACWKW